MFDSRTKHACHCTLLITVIVVFEVNMGGVKLTGIDEVPIIDPLERYGYLGSILLYTIRLITFLSLPQVFFNFAGWTLYNAFKDYIVLKCSPLLTPFICVRVVTRGDYPNLVRKNVNRNLIQCLDAGLDRFVIEVVTDRPINLPKDRRIQETVVPVEYKTKSGALYKARALQYCLEDGVNGLSDSDWIVHLDEETLLTENSIKGIMNFVVDGKHHFGQGLITYNNEKVANWFTTLADSYRVADDMGKLRFQFYMFHKPILSWKGSYVVSQMKAEKEVSFDNGLDGSIAEDCFFAMRAYKEGYSFNFIEGEMWEKSPFTFWDFIQQRKRWLQGILLVVHSKQIPFKNKFFLGMSCYSWVTMPLSISNVYLATLFPIPCPFVVDVLCAFVAAVNIYMYVFGVIKSFPPKRFGFVKCYVCIIGALAMFPINLIVENIAVIWGLLGEKHKFYVVNKDLTPPTIRV